MTNAGGAPWLREEIDHAALAPERRDDVDVVLSAYASVMAPLSYLTMPVTTGRRYYDVLDANGVTTVADLEAKCPGALRDEVIVPNVEASVALGRAITARTGHTLIVPGVFEARRKRWSQAEYMVLWLRVISRHVGCVHLSPDWAYSNGGAMEYARATLVRHGCLPGRDAAMDVVDHEGSEVPLDRGVTALLAASADLTARGHDASVLRREAGRLAGYAAMVAQGDGHDRTRAGQFPPLPDCAAVVRAAADAGVAVAFDMR